MIAGTLEIKLMAEMASLKRGMDEAHRTVTGAMGRIEDSLSKAARALGAFGGTLAVEAIVNGLNKVYDSLAELDDMAQKTGASIEKLSVLQKVANATSTEFGRVDDAIVKLAKGMATADSETNKTQAALKALGVSAKDASGKLRDPGEVMIEVARRLQLYQDGAAKAALMTDLLGKSGAQLLPYLNDVSQMANRFGAESSRSAAMAAAFGDAVGMMRQRASDAFTLLALQFLPALLNVADAMNGASTSAHGLNDAFSWLGQSISFVVKSVAVIGFAISNVFDQTSSALAAVIAIMVRITNLDFSGALGIGKAWKADAIAIHEAWKLALDTIINGKKQLEGGAGGQSVLDYMSGEKADKAGSAKALKDQLTDYQKLSFEISKLTAERYRQIAAGRELTPVEKQLSDLASSIADGSKKMTDGEFSAAQAMIRESGAVSQLVDEQNKLIAARQKIAEITGQSQVDEMDRLERLKMESDLVGRTAAQQAIIRAEYESQQRLKRTVSAIADAGAGVRDPEEEAQHIAQLKSESEARIKIIKDEATSKARAQLDAVALQLQQFKASKELVEVTGLKVAAQRAFDVVEAERSAHRGRMDAIDDLEKRQLDYFRTLEQAADQAQSAMLDKEELVRLAETERIKEIRRLRKTGEAHNIELAEQYAKTVNNRNLMETVGYAIAKRKYDLAAQELETAQKSLDVKDTESLRRAEIEKFQKRINDLQAEAFDQVDMQRFGEREIEKQKAEQLKLAAEQYVQLEKQIKAGTGIVEIQKEQLQLQARIKQYQDGTSAGNTASLKAEEESRKRLEQEIAILQERAYQQRWRDRIDRFEQDLRTSWLRLLDHNTQSWDAFVKGLLNTFKVSLFDEIYKMLLKPITLKLVASVIGLTGSAAANAAADKALTAVISESGFSDKFKTMDWLTVGKTIWTGLSDGFFSFGEAISQGFAKFGSYLYSSGLSDAGMSLMSSAHSLGVAASYIGAAAAGISIGTLLAGDKSVLGMDGLTTSSIGAVIGAIFGGPIGGFIGGALGGVVNALFGMGEKRYGPTNVVGSFSGSGFAGNLQSEWTQKGGPLRSNKSGVDSQDLSQKAQDTLNGITLGVATAFGKLLSVTGESARSIDGWTFAIKRQLTTEEEMKTLIHDLGNSMGEYLIPEIKDFKKDGESLADTAIRLTDTFIVTQAIYDMLGHSAYATGLASLKMRDDLVQLFGGLQQTSSAMSAFYSNFYTADEQRANSWRQLDNTFKALNLTTPQTREEFRALAEAQDLATEEGRLMFVALMQLAPAFAAVTDSIEELEKQSRQAMESIAGSLDALRGNKNASLAMATMDYNKAMADLAASTAISSWEQLITIAMDDAQNYSAANQELIAAALAAGAALEQLSRQAEESIGGSLDKLRGNTVASRLMAQMKLDDAMAALTASAPWIKSWEQLATITFEDASKYSVANQILIANALAAGAALKDFADKKIADAFEALRRAVDAEKDRLTKIYNDQAKALNDNISKLRGLSDALGNALDSINPMSRRAAQAQLTSALLLAKTGGIFPTADELSGALRAVSEPSEKLFSNFVDFKRDQAYTTITIDALKKLTDNQLSTEELTLKQLEETHNAEMERLDSIISTAQAQIDALNGINNSVLSVAQALANFAAAMGISTTPNSPTSAGSGSGSSGGSASMILPNGQFNTSLNGPITRGTYQGLPIGMTEADAGGINWVEGYGNAVDPYAEVQRRIALRQALGIPGFASGGVHSGGWRWVGEDGPELEYTPPSRIYSNGDSRKMLDFDALASEVRELRKDVRAGHIAIERNTSESARHLRRIENEGITINNESSNPVQTEVVA